MDDHIIDYIIESIELCDKVVVTKTNYSSIVIEATVVVEYPLGEKTVKCFRRENRNG